MAKNTHYLALSDCITISDAEIIRQEKKDKRGNPIKKTKTLNRLAREMVKGDKVNSHSAIYTKMYRLEREGFQEEPKELVKKIMKALDVSREELIKAL